VLTDNGCIIKGDMFKKESPRILIVEDNHSNYQLFTAAFEAVGFVVSICPYVDTTFIDDVAAIQPDIISMDIMIPSVGVDLPYDGLSAIGLLKADERTRDIPVMVLTTFFEETKVERAKREGAVDFINLQGYSITSIPKIFKRYLKDSKHYRPEHPVFRVN
jgi:CheY-like chemotaxis protein